jgi:hypothetical protein
LVEVPPVPAENALSYFDFPAPGSTIKIHYPKKNRHYFGRDPRRFRAKAILERTIVVLTIEDGQQIPIPIGAFLKRPTIRRGRWRIIAWEPAKNDLRTFYPDCDQPCRLQLGMWNPRTGECLMRIGETYEQTAEGLLELRDACRELMKEYPEPTDTAAPAIYAAA